MRRCHPKNIGLDENIETRKSSMTISLITVVYNGVETIKNTIESVIKQSYSNIEYIVIDGGSTDGTIELVNSFGGKITKFISEPDRGIYDAMNKGIREATGDIIGFINADDFYESSEIICNVAKTFRENKTDCLLGDVKIVDAFNLNKINRYYQCPKFPIEFLRYGIMPPHPAFFVKRCFYDQYGLFKTDYKIAADYELVVRFLYTYKLSFYYLPTLVVTMRNGGISNSGLGTKQSITNEILRACKENNLSTNRFLLNLRYFYKLKQMLFFKRQ